MSLKSIACAACRATTTIGHGIKRRKLGGREFHEFVRGSTQGGECRITLIEWVG